VARKAQLDFFPQERKRPVAFPRFFHQADHGTNCHLRTSATGILRPALRCLPALGIERVNG
jgi:hypothetical protein